jgi:ABC-type transport system involved in multi-copper enzyme maturation permease subunit
LTGSPKELGPIGALHAFLLPRPEGLAMAIREGLGLGPVYAFEWLTATRRWQMYAGRSGFVALLLLGLGLAWTDTAGRLDLAQIKVQAQVAHEFYQALVGIALVMVLLAAPAATAGAICLDKARGTLLHVLVTDLSDSEIVLGKLAARLVPVLGLIASSLPVLALLTLMGGIDPVALTGSFVVLLGVAVLGCTLALALSVWGRKTHEVLLATYLAWIIWFLLVPGAAFVSWHLGYGFKPPDAILRSNVFVLTASANNPSDPSSPGIGDQVLFLAVAVGVSAALLTLTVKRLRPVIVGQWGGAERPERASVRARLRASSRLGPALDDNPVLWREWHRNRPSRWGRVIWRVYVVLAVGFSVLSLQWIWAPTGAFRELPAVISGFQASIGLLLLSVTSATSLAEERSRGSLDVVLASPLPTSSIVWGKWWGAYRSVLILAILPTLVASLLATNSGRWIGPLLILGLFLAYGAAITSLGLALATWIANLGRVLALCVAAVVGMTVGSLPVVLSIFSDRGPSTPCIAMVSPFFGIGYYSDVIAGHERPETWPLATGFAVFWIAVYGMAAVVLGIAARDTFDRCLGRMSERPIVPPYVRGGWKPKRKPAAVILDEV